MNVRIALLLLVCLVIAASSSNAQSQNADSLSVPTLSQSDREELVTRRNRLNKTSRLFTILTVAFTVSYIVTENETHHPSPYLVVGGLASATISLITAIKARRLDKKIRMESAAGN